MVASNPVLTHPRPVAGGGTGGARAPPPEFLEVEKHYN